MAIEDNTLYGLTGAQIKELPGKIEAIKGLAKVLTTDDYNANSSNWSDTDPTNFNCVALCRLPDGTYTFDNLRVALHTTTYSVFSGVAIVSASETYNTVSIIFLNTRVNRLWVDVVNKTTMAYISAYEVLYGADTVNDLVTSSTDRPLSAAQGKTLKGLIDSLVIKNAGAPTTATVGTVGKLLEDTTNGKLYQCTNVSGNTYTWTPISTTNITSRTSGLTSVPVQNLDLAGDPSTNKPYALKSVVNGNEQSWGYLRGGIAAGGSKVGTAYAGVYSYDGNEDVWQSAESRLALYSDLDGRVKQNAGAPTTSTVGTVGQLYQDTTNGDLYICTDATNPYVWEEVGSGGGGASAFTTNEWNALWA